MTVTRNLRTNQKKGKFVATLEVSSNFPLTVAENADNN